MCDFLKIKKTPENCKTQPGVIHMFLTILNNYRYKNKNKDINFFALQCSLFLHVVHITPINKYESILPQRMVFNKTKI